MKKKEDCKTYKLKEQKWATTILARSSQNDLDNKAKL